jgi:thioredoxin 1
MNKSIPFLLLICLLLPACAQKNNSISVKNLSTEEFAKQISSNSSKIILDVRTPEEFAQNHIEGAVNMNINGDDFEAEISRLDTSLPLFVYCLSGNRSGRAAAILVEKGYPAVYNMDGGMSRWNGENRPVVAQSGEDEKGITVAQYTALLSAGDSLVLVDFHAKWCAPCKKILAYLPELEKEFTGKMKIVKINYDDNTRIVKSQKLDNVPFLFIYKNGKEVWRHSGFADKATVLKGLNDSK